MTLKAELRFLRVHALVTTGAIVMLVSTGFAKQSSARFETIDVERINVIEKNGQVRLVISNKARSPAPIERGQAFGYQPGNRAGMIFYNEEGTEQGGITYTGHRDSAGNYQAVGSLTFDQYEQDQTVALQYFDQNGRRRAGLAINDYPLGMSGLQFDRRYQRGDDGQRRESGLDESPRRTFRKAEALRRAWAQWIVARLAERSGRTSAAASQR